jgi:hypothetical protein
MSWRETVATLTGTAARARGRAACAGTGPWVQYQ